MGRGCLRAWLRTAQTCPMCRTRLLLPPSAFSSSAVLRRRTPPAVHALGHRLRLLRQRRLESYAELVRGSTESIGSIGSIGTRYNTTYLAIRDTYNLHVRAPPMHVWNRAIMQEARVWLSTAEEEYRRLATGGLPAPPVAGADLPLLWEGPGYFPPFHVSDFYDAELRIAPGWPWGWIAWVRREEMLEVRPRRPVTWGQLFRDSFNVEGHAARFRALMEWRPRNGIPWMKATCVKLGGFFGSWFMVVGALQGPAT